MAEKAQRLVKKVDLILFVSATLAVSAAVDYFKKNERLEITLNDRVKFYSEVFEGSDWKDDARTLDSLAIKTDYGEWEYIPREKIQNYVKWKDEYESLIGKIYQYEREFQDNARREVKERLH